MVSLRRRRGWIAALAPKSGVIVQKAGSRTGAAPKILMCGE